MLNVGINQPPKEPNFWKAKMLFRVHITKNKEVSVVQFCLKSNVEDVLLNT